MRAVRIFRNIFLILRYYRVLKFSFAILRNSGVKGVSSQQFLRKLDDQQLDALEFLQRLYLMLEQSPKKNKENFREIREVQNYYLSVFSKDTLNDTEK